MSNKGTIRLSNDQLSLEVQVLGLMQGLLPSLMENLPNSIKESIGEIGKLEEDFIEKSMKTIESAKNLIEAGQSDDEGSPVHGPVMMASMKMFQMMKIVEENRPLDTLQSVHILEKLSILTKVPSLIVAGYDLKNDTNEIETISLSVPNTIYHRHNRHHYLHLSSYHVILAFIKMGSISESVLEILPPLQMSSDATEAPPNPMHG